MWIYKQTEGWLIRVIPIANTMQFIGDGYSGTGAGRNNPEMEAVHNVGPIPRGEWVMGPLLETTESHGPYVIRLTPVGHDAFGRTGFLIHGNNKDNDASQGCIILSYELRVAVWKYGFHDPADRTLKVCA